MTKRVKLINKYEFVEETLDKNLNTFVICITALEASKFVILIYLLRTFFLAGLQDEKAQSEIRKKYPKYTNIFSSNKARKLKKNTRINKYEM